mmetsp:Transcript_18298/g.25191  ORF Transcript_18298/g.25191 Transcript_18298/m.25191 type:complete len:113 (-) Transcript_18298:260-598(-)
MEKDEGHDMFDDINDDAFLDLDISAKKTNVENHTKSISDRTGNGGGHDLFDGINDDAFLDLDVSAKEASIGNFSGVESENKKENCRNAKQSHNCASCDITSEEIWSLFLQML